MLPDCCHHGRLNQVFQRKKGGKGRWLLNYLFSHWKIISMYLFNPLWTSLVNVPPVAGKFTLLVCSRHTDVQFPTSLCLVLLPPSLLMLDSSSTLILWGRRSKVDNGQQSNFTAPASDRHRVILGGTLSILLSAYPQEHSELNQTLISPLLCW